MSLSVLSLRRLPAVAIAAFLEHQRHAPFSYTSATREHPPRGYAIDHNRVRLGHGRRTFERAVDAVRRWEMLNIGWIELCWASLNRYYPARACTISMGCQDSRELNRCRS